MTAKITFVQKGSDPATLVWPPHGGPGEQWQFANGVAQVIAGLIPYGDGTITFPDGRPFPTMTAQGSTLTHGK